MENKNYYEIRKKYLAEAMAFLGFKYFKNGFGQETKYKFEDTEEFRKALTGLMELKEKVGQYLE